MSVNKLIAGNWKNEWRFGFTYLYLEKFSKFSIPKTLKLYSALLTLMSK